MLHLHRAARADVLAQALATLLSDPPGDPLAPELVAVPTHGMERWLTQTMSAVLGAREGARDGVCANVLFPTPHRLVSDAVALASGIEPDTDPWRPERLVWPLLDVVDASLGERWLAALARYLGATGEPDPVRHERRLSIVRHLAALFDRYALHRPEMLQAWAEGHDAGAEGGPLPDSAAWQAELWRRVRARVAVPGPAERRALACARLIEDPALAALPARLTLFGLTRLPAGHLGVLRALAATHEVHLLLLHPSPALWSTLAAASPGALAPGRRRAADRSADHVANRLLSSWGRDAREMQLVLASDADAHAEGHADGDTARDIDIDIDIAVGAEPTHPPATLLARLQADIRADRAAPGAPLAGAADERAVLAVGDDSIVVHSCHGRVRQVEVLRDAILHALAADETLEPRDVIVMCPDVESFAPLIQATFGAGEAVEDEQGSVGQVGDRTPHASHSDRQVGDRTPHASHSDRQVGDRQVGDRTPHASHSDRGRRVIDLRVRLADRSLTQTNPVLGVVSVLMELVDRRLTASEVLDLADRGPVRRRFGLDDEDLTRLQDWITQAGIRWGLDAEHRAPYRLSAVPEGTWQAGIDRLLLGVTMTEDDQRLFADVLPLDDVDSRSIELAGRLAELVARLRRSLDALGERRPLAEWAQALGEAADALTDTTGRDRWQRAELQRILDEMASDAAGDAEPPALAPAEVRSHLAARLAGRPTRANFRTGHLTVCTLMPMRSVPHRVVCLLGLDDGAFPRRAPRDGDDLMLADPHIGERDPRSEDRQLLLDAVMAATERVIVTYTGNDERTNSHRPPAVPVGELLDAIDATVRAGDGTPARERVVVCHPLQPFDPRNFAPGALGGPDPWSFDEVALQGARALTAARHPPPPFLAAPLPALAGAELDLDDLVAFAGHPVRAFLRRRLEISMFERDDEVADGLPIELDPLQRWDVANRLLEALLHGTSLRVAAAAEKARGTLPPGALGDRVIDDVKRLVIDIATEVDRLAPRGEARDPIDVRVALAGGRLLSGTVTGVTGTVLLSSSYSRVSPRHRIAAWIRLLALTASHPQERFAAATVGRGRGRDDVRVAWIPPLNDDPAQRRAIAVDELGRLVDLYERGMREPLPLYSRTSAAWAEGARPGAGDPRADAEKAWQTRWQNGARIEGEDADLSHQLVLAGRPSFAALADRAPSDGEEGDGWAQEETSRLGRLARRLWDGLLDREQRGAR